MSNAPNSTLDSFATFGRRSGPPQFRARGSFHPSPALLAYALRREDAGSLRRIVLERLYRNLTVDERRVCDAERWRIADAW
jgi:hypothetical protein